MVLVPDGTFILGLTDDDPLQFQTAGLRRITLSRFYIDQYEVSNADYLRFIAEAPPERRAALLPDTTMEQVTGNRFSAPETRLAFLGEGRRRHAPWHISGCRNARH